MTGVGVGESAGRRVEDAVEAGHEHALRHLRQQDLVGSLEHCRWFDEARRFAAQDGLRAGHDQRRGHALVGHVADDDADAAVRQRDEVVEVAAYRPGGAVVGGDLPAVQLGQLARQELLLDEGRDAHLLFEPLARLGLDGLLAHELGDADGRRGLGGQGGQAACDRRSSSPGQTGVARGRGRR